MRGRKRWTSRLTVEECLCLDAMTLSRDGVFSSAFGNEWVGKWPDAHPECTIRFSVIELPACAMALRISVLWGEPGRIQHSAQTRVEVTTTPCRFGGRRFWFRCPIEHNGIPCKRRVLRLYLPPGREKFGCRRCYDLTYRSCQQHDNRVYALARCPELLQDALRSKKLGLALRGAAACTLLLKRARREIDSPRRRGR
jgi:hypothetical protein